MIKEYCEPSARVVIRESRYGSQLDKFIRLYEEALKDFPNLKMRDVEIVKYAGERYAKTFGIEFHSPFAPDTYARISALEYT
jgi:hypothetical protein